MKIALTSDLHYGFNHKTRHLHKRFWAKVAGEIAAQNIEVLILAGDIASSKVLELQECLKLMREYVKIPVLVVRGNHDWWDALDAKDPESDTRNIPRINELHKRWFKNYDVRHLEDGPFVLDGVQFVGWDGWYADPHVQTNDARNMPALYEGLPTGLYMVNRAWKEFTRVLGEVDSVSNRAVVAVTHHNPYVTDPAYAAYAANEKFYEEILQYADVFCCGHNHQFRNDVVPVGRRLVRVANAGSDYNNPKFLVFEV